MLYFSFLTLCYFRLRTLSQFLVRESLRLLKFVELNFNEFLPKMNQIQLKLKQILYTLFLVILTLRYFHACNLS